MHTYRDKPRVEHHKVFFFWNTLMWIHRHKMMKSIIIKKSFKLHTDRHKTLDDHCHRAGVGIFNYPISTYSKNSLAGLVRTMSSPTTLPTLITVLLTFPSRPMVPLTARLTLEPTSVAKVPLLAFANDVTGMQASVFHGLPHFVHGSSVLNEAKR